MISIIVARDKMGVIGYRGDMPWRGQLPADMSRFKHLTSGHPVIMGRKTFISIPSRFRPLPERSNIVLSRSVDWHEKGIIKVSSLRDALDVAGEEPGGNQEIFVIGGSQLYALALPITHRVYMTIVQAQFAGDCYFPRLGSGEWKLIRCEGPFPASRGNQYQYTFETYERTE